MNTAFILMAQYQTALIPAERVAKDYFSLTTDKFVRKALAVIKTMPRTDPRIFPFGSDAITAAFTRACKMTGIEDLHFHDLRHEGVSRLFEMGWNIPQVATVSGHRSWQSLKRYTHMDEVGDKWAGWDWAAAYAG